MSEFYHITCHVGENEGTKTIPIGARRLICFGYSGRDREEVETHIRQLEPLGIPAPEKVPTIMEVSPWLLTDSMNFRVQGFHTSGEVEFVLIGLPSEDELLVGVGSDHGDLELERIDGAMAKQMGPKVLSKELWKFSDVVDHWDALEMRAWVTVDGKRWLHQFAGVSVLLHPNTLLQLYRERVADSLEGAVIFSGTISCLESLVYPTRFEAELYDPIMKRSISLDYHVEAFDRNH
jgi:hypothetical protein